MSDVVSEARQLLAWYDGRRRKLPWRENRSPYRVWISEIMLQQTQVSTVLPYYQAFLDRFPDVHTLAAAELDEVLASWSGLGYYRRARQLHAAAEKLAVDGFPSTAVELQRLPGIGPYTAAAIASIVFDEVVPVLDGNVERVMCRRLALAENPKRSAVRRRLAAAAAELLDADRPGDSNQALMELGATVCRPTAPDCPTCPLATGCRARIAGDPERFPPPRKRRRRERLDLVVAVVERDGAVLLFKRRSASSLLAGLWELPNVVTPAPPADRAVVEAALGERYGGRWQLASSSSSIRHSITHRAIYIEVHRGAVAWDDEVAEGPEAAWVRPDERRHHALSSMFDKALRAL